MGKIKMIYIDPPYNTGNDFIYNDTFADSTEDYLRKTGEKSDEGLLVSNPKSSGKYHANWLSFMYPRLRLAKDLLREDGVIFISIGDRMKLKT
jgi:adenine-specific DNA-methyltransferase